MINKKGTLVLSNMVIALAVFSFCIAGFWAAFATMAPAYDIGVNESYVKPFDKLNSTNTLSTRLGANQENLKASTVESVVSFVSSGASGLLIMFESVTVIKDLAFEMTKFFGIPNSVFILFVTVLLIAVTAAIAAALLRAPEI